MSRQRHLTRNIDGLLTYCTVAICPLAILYFLVRTWGWPFMGDSGFIHYVVFLTHHGMAPYKDIIEINTPGAYITEQIAMAVCGTGALGWRVFDFLLLLIVGISYFSILRKEHPIAGIFAGTLFMAIHGQDGVMVSGARDLICTSLQIASVALLLIAIEKQPRWRPAGYLYVASGLLASWSACIKPPDALELVVILAWLAFVNKPRVNARVLSLIVLGAVVPWLICYLYLARYHAVAFYYEALRGVIAYHVSLERKTLSYLLLHAFSPILLVAILGLAIFVLRRRMLSSREILLGLCAGAGLVSYIVQGKGFPYQRYPFLVFLVPLLVLWIFESTNDLRSANVLRVAVFCVALALICISTIKLGTYSHTDPDQMLGSDLSSLGVADSSGSVQCLDMLGGCIQTLYKQRLVQSTGFIYDCYFEDAKNDTVRALREEFAEKMTEASPEWIVETNSSCLSYPRTFNKFANWSWFDRFLGENYTLVLERDPSTPVRYWSRMSVPYAYRIYRKLRMNGGPGGAGKAAALQPRS